MPQPPLPAGTPVAAPTVTDAVTTALALGWQMARLYDGSVSSNTEPKVEHDLPGLSDLPANLLVDLGLAQADVALKELGAFLGARVTLPTTGKVRKQRTEAPTEKTKIQGSILALHIELLVALTAADFRLGKAYGLGRALADTCSLTPGDEAERTRWLNHHLERHRALVLVGWLDDLKTVLEPHAGQAVADSFQRWIEWAQTVDLDKLDAEEVSHTTRVLHRSGQRWRAVLTGEKNAKDILKMDDYLTAARGLLQRAGAISASFAWQLRVPLSLAAFLIGVGVVLMFVNNSTGQVIAGLGSVAGGLGITWRSATTALGNMSVKLGESLWGAEIDVAVANSLTPMPQREYLPEVTCPRGRLRRAVRELKTGEDDAPRGASSPPLATKAQPGRAQEADAPGEE
jgi:hypothetical protein